MSRLEELRPEVPDAHTGIGIANVVGVIDGVHARRDRAQDNLTVGVGGPREAALGVLDSERHLLLDADN